MNADEFQKYYPRLPDKPGVYQYFDHQERVLYIGKAKSLRKRVSSYFQNTPKDTKTRALVRQIARISYILVATEHDAFLLENNLIKQHQPKYNINLKDDKSFPYISILSERFPRVLLTRNPADKNDNTGPFSSVVVARELIKYFQEHYFLRTCQLSLTEKNITARKFRPCLQYHLRRCKAPCAGLQSPQEYDNAIQEIRHILKGNISPIARRIRADMHKAAQNWEFELAHRKKTQLDLLLRHAQGSQIEAKTKINADIFAFTRVNQTGYVNYLRAEQGKIVFTHMSVFDIPLVHSSDEDILSTVILQLRERFSSQMREIIVDTPPRFSPPHTVIVVPKRGDRKQFLTLAQKNISHHLQTKHSERPKGEDRLQKVHADLRLPVIPRYIESFDNSHFQGAAPVSAMVCFREGEPSKSDYRIFNIKQTKGIDDVAFMYEAVYRRYRRLLRENKTLPDLVVIDGGKGQLNAAVCALDRLGVREKTNIIGLAKNLEEIFLPDQKEPLCLPYHSESLLFLRSVRDETHRFVLQFHRRQRNKLTLQNRSPIQGDGKTTPPKPSSTFSSTEEIRRKK